MKLIHDVCAAPRRTRSASPAPRWVLTSILAGGLLSLAGCADSDPAGGAQSAGANAGTNGVPQSTTAPEATTGSPDTTGGMMSTTSPPVAMPTTGGMMETTGSTTGVTTGTTMPPADAGMADGSTGDGGETPMMGTGTCCADGNCLCHGPDPSGLTSEDGSFAVQEMAAQTGTLFYPTDAEPPFAAVAVCGGFLNSGPEMNAWGSFYASHGIVALITATLPTDFPDVRATKLLASIEELKGFNTDSSSPLSGKLSGRYGTSGYSMGGGGTTIASGQDSTLLTSVGLAPWSPNGSGVTVPTLLLCGTADTTAPCNMAQGGYDQIPDSTPKMMIEINGGAHLSSWFGPKDGGQGGISGGFALAFQKVYLEGDERWKPMLEMSPADGSQKSTNIQ